MSQPQASTCFEEEFAEHYNHIIYDSENQKKYIKILEDEDKNKLKILL